VSLLSHDRYQYDSLILSKQTWAYPPQHLKQLLWCVVSVRLNSPEVEERKLCLWYTPTSRNHKELSLDLQHNVESVYFFYSNPVFISDYMVLTPGMSRQIAFNANCRTLRVMSGTYLKATRSDLCQCMHLPCSSLFPGCPRVGGDRATGK